MKTTKSFFAILIIAFISIFNNKVNAQNPGQGTSYTNPYNLNTCVDSISENDSVLWFSFVASQPSVFISITYPSHAMLGSVSKVLFYKLVGSPNPGLVLVDSAVGDLPDSLISFPQDSLIAGTIYYIKTIQAISASNMFNICATPLNLSGSSCTYTFTCSNYCPNGDFESYQTCPTTQNEVPFSCNWVNPSNGEGQSPDYYNTCNGGGSVGIPQNTFGNQTPHSGNAYVGIYIIENVPNPNLGYPNNGYREYIQEKLAAPLNASETYSVSYWVSLPKGTGTVYHGVAYASDRIGAYFSNTAPFDNSNSNYKIISNMNPFTYYPTGQIVPQVQSPVGVPVVTSGGANNWVQISGTFTAVGGEDYITIGNFYPLTASNGGGTTTAQVNTDPSALGNFSGNPDVPVSYYYIDDVVVTPVLNVTVNPTNVTRCSNDPGTPLVASGAPMYTWSPAAGLSCTNCANPIATPSVTTTYIVTGYDANGCSATASVTIIVHPSPTVHINGPVGCISSPTIITAVASLGSPLYNYSWSPGGQTTQSITINPPAFTETYTVTVTDKNGCTASATYTASAPPSIRISPNPLYICNGGSGTATINVGINDGTAMYTWSAGGPSGGSWGGPGSYIYYPVFYTPGIYTLTVSGLAGCTSTASITVKQDPTLVISPNIITNVKCNGDNNGKASVTVTGGMPPYDFLWNNGETTNPANGLSTGTYTVTVTDKIGCTGTVSVTITQPPALIINMNSTPSCNSPFNGTATASVFGGTPGYFYSWSNGQTTSTITGLSPGNYTVHVQDANGCSIRATIRVTIDNGPSATISGPANACNPAAIYTVTASGGILPYNYTWSSSNGNNGTASTGVPNFNPATGGTITWVVTDKNGCSTTDTYTVTPCCAPGSYPIVLSNVTSSSLGAPPYNFNSTTILIDGTFTIDQNTNFNGCDVQFTSNAEIILTNNAHLQIIESPGFCSHLHAANGCCMWQGIFVNPGCSLYTTDLTVIEDAKIAVTSISSGTSLGLLDVEFSYFNKNYEDIVFAGNATVPNTSTILNCVFTCRDFTNILPCPSISSPATWQSAPLTTLICPYAGQYTFRGIDISNQNSITITPGNSLLGNTFDNLHCGIYSVASNLALYNNTFQNIAFNFTDVAINCAGSPGGNSLTVGGFITFPVPQPNTFTNCYNGIYVHDYMTNVSILQNSFTNPTVMGFGIEEARSNLTGSTLTIEKNNITNSLVGIECLNNLNTVANINYNNVIDNLSPASGTEIGIEASEVSHPVNAFYTIDQNTVNVLNYGIYTNSLSFPWIQQNPVVLGLGIAAPPAAYNGTGIYATNCINANIINNSPITTQAFSIGNTPANYIGISESSCSYINIECNTINDATTHIECIGAPTSFGSQVVENVFNIPTNTGSTGLDIDNYAFLNFPITSGFGNPGDNIWSNRPFICRSTIDATSTPCYYNTSHPIGSFWDPALGSGFCNYPTTTYNILGSAPPCPGLLPPPPPAALKPIATLQSPFNSLPQATTSLLVQGLINTLWTNASLLTDSLLHHFNDSIMLTSLGQIMQADTLLGDSSAVDLANTLAKVKSIAPASNIEGDMQTVAENYLTYRITNSLSASDIRKLRDIANKCPFKDGLAIYQARALLTFFDPTGTIYIDDPACEKSHRAVKSEKGNGSDDNQNANSSTISIYPNPANTLLNVMVNLEQGESAQICLYNSLGQLVQCQELQDNLTTLPTSSLAAGIYYYRILDENGTLLKADKQMIVH